MGFLEARGLRSFGADAFLNMLRLVATLICLLRVCVLFAFENVSSESRQQLETLLSDESGGPQLGFLYRVSVLYCT